MYFDDFHSLGVDYLHPEWNSFDQDSLEDTGSVFKFDTLKSSHPVSIQIDNPYEILSYFDDISYEKGSSVIRMMHLFLGHDVFFDGVANYLDKYRFDNAEQDDLWDALNEAAQHHGKLNENFTVKQIMDTWTLQTGYPIINITRNYENNSAKINQYRFLLEPNKTRKLSDRDGPCWYVPLSYTTEQELNFNRTEPKTWLQCDSDYKSIENEIVDLPEHDKWIIFNIKLSGIYRVTYDDNNWNLLTRQLIGPDFSKIPTLNRATLINDAFSLAW